MHTLKEKFNRRYLNIRKRGVIIPIELKDALWILLLENHNNGFRCEYCKKKLLINDSKKYFPDVFSFDHIKSLDVGGTNDITNFAICCHACNIIKGTTEVDIFKKLISCLTYGEVDQWFVSAWKGRLANKLDREDKRK